MSELVDSLKTKREELVATMHSLDNEAAQVRGEAEKQRKELQEEHQPLVDRLNLISDLIRMESDEDLIKQLKDKQAEVSRQLETVQGKISAISEEEDKKLADIRERRQPLENHLRKLDELISAEGGK